MNRSNTSACSHQEATATISSTAGGSPSISAAIADETGRQVPDCPRAIWAPFSRKKAAIRVAIINRISSASPLAGRV